MKLVIYALALVAIVLSIAFLYRWTALEPDRKMGTPMPAPPLELPLPPTPDEAAEVKASRVFAGPDQYPPEEFAAYGIVAFPSRASPHTKDRHVMICNAYVATLPHADELPVPRIEQMATVWPVREDAVADVLNHSRQPDVCEKAVLNYGLTLAKRALKEAMVAGVETAGLGPFLLAWSPSTDKGKKDALVLVSDLSDVTTYAQAESILLAWSNDIESDPTLWKNGWNVERLRLKIRHWVDNYGSRTLAIIGLKND
jgi:hypothetical protein